MPSWAPIVANTILQPHLRAIGSGTLATRQTPVHALLYHAANNLDTAFGKPLEPALWDLTCQHPHLLASILAVSACDMRLLAPADPLPHRIAECSLLSVALHLFQPALEQPLNQARSDALLLTSMLLNHLAFASVDMDEGGRPAAHGLAFCGSSSLGSGGFGWLALSMGLKPLLMATEAFREESLLMPIFQASGDQDQTFPPPQDSLDHVPAAWSRLASGVGCLQEPIKSLAGIQALPPSPQNALGFVQFVGTLEPEFLQLLYDGDERAMWALGCWLGLVGHLDTSWSRGRVRRDGAAIRSFLLSSGVCQRRGEDGAMWRKLIHDYDCIYTSASSNVDQKAALPPHP